MNYYKPLTPELRRKTLEAINSQMAELNTCYPTAFVSAEKERMNVLKIIFNTLPDGYPIPFEMTEK